MPPYLLLLFFLFLFFLTFPKFLEQVLAMTQKLEIIMKPEDRLTKLNLAIPLMENGKL